MQLSDFLDAGITTAVGVLGTDTITRSQVTPLSLLAAHYLGQTLLSSSNGCTPIAHVGNTTQFVAMLWHTLPFMS